MIAGAMVPSTLDGAGATKRRRYLRKLVGMRHTSMAGVARVLEVSIEAAKDEEARDLIKTTQRA